jgi:hypothetical protein
VLYGIRLVNFLAHKAFGIDISQLDIVRFENATRCLGWSYISTYRHIFLASSADLTFWHISTHINVTQRGPYIHLIFKKTALAAISHHILQAKALGPAIYLKFHTFSPCGYITSHFHISSPWANRSHISISFSLCTLCKNSPWAYVR